MNGRVEIYVHSDSTTKNKGACVVRVLCQSEAGSRTEEFIDFCSKVAMLSYGVNSENWEEVTKEYPSLNETKKELEGILHESVSVDEIKILLLDKPESIN